MSNLVYKTLKREIKISPKSLVILEYNDNNQFSSATVDIQIGTSRCSLTMDESAYKALKNGEEIKIITAKEFRNKVK